MYIYIEIIENRHYKFQTNCFPNLYKHTVVIDKIPLRSTTIEIWYTNFQIATKEVYGHIRVIQKCCNPYKKITLMTINCIRWSDFVLKIPLLVHWDYFQSTYKSTCILLRLFWKIKTKNLISKRNYKISCSISLLRLWILLEYWTPILNMQELTEDHASSPWIFEYLALLFSIKRNIYSWY